MAEREKLVGKAAEFKDGDRRIVFLGNTEVGVFRAPFIDTLPTLDTGEEWEYKPEFDSYASKPSKTNRTKKVPKNHIKYEATKEHPAQVEMYMEDVGFGTWTTVKFSGAIPAATKNAMLDRVNKLLDSVKTAREEANNLDVPPVKVGNTLLGYIFAAK